MGSCCENKGCEVSALKEKHSRVLWAVLIINALMFVVEGVAGLLAGSTSLLASAWPDIIVGAAIALLFLHSATGVLRDAVLELKTAHS